MSVWLLALLLFGQAAPRTGALEGFVVREGTSPLEPLVNARVELFWTGESFVARTDTSGRFLFPNLPATRFRMAVTKDGYVRHEYRAVDLKPGQTLKDLVFRMEPAPTISGIIRDRQGSPIANILVGALRRAYDARGNRTLTLAASTRTDDHGEYRLYWLDPGEYFISAERQSIAVSRDSAMAYPTTYFPGFAEPEDAKPVFIEAGRDAGGMDFTLSERPFVKLTVYVTSRTTPRLATATVSLMRPEIGASTAHYQAQARDGIATIEGVAPGAYIIYATSGSETAATRIRLRNEDLLVRLQISSGVALSGIVVNANGSAMDLRTARIGVAEVDPALPLPAAAAVSRDNRFSIDGVQPGTYSLNVSGLPEDLYVRAAEIGATDALAAPFAVQTSGDLKILIGLDGGRVSGTVLGRDDQPVPGAQIVLVPETDSRFRYDRYRRAVSGDDGSFSLRGIAPGEYKLFALDRIESNAEFNTEYMRGYESMGTLVRVVPGENAAPPLRLIQAR